MSSGLRLFQGKKKRPYKMDEETWFWLNTERRGECLESCFSAKSASFPYGQYLSGSAHRYAYKSLRGEIPAGQVVRHLCHNPRCVRIEHLAVGTQAQNHGDSKHLARHSHGEHHGMSKLKAEDVREIRRLRADGVGSTNLARQYGIARSTIKRVLRRKAWRHVA